MTGSQINSFVGNLVEMAKAFEELPGVRQALAEAEFNSATLADTIAQREASILRLKAELEAAHEATRKVEAERDEAIQSFLDADDRTKRILDFVKTTFGNAGALIQAVEPAKPVAEAKPEPEAYEPPPSNWGDQVKADPLAESPLVEPGQSAEGESMPTSSAPITTGSSETAHSSNAEPSVSASSSPAPEVAFTPSPTPAPSAPTGTGTESDRSSSDPDASSPAPTGPYVGRRYVDVPAWISLSDWLAGGGTEANYYW